jgi:hypothetical protein
MWLGQLRKAWLPRAAGVVAIPSKVVGACTPQCISCTYAMVLCIVLSGSGDVGSGWRVKSCYCGVDAVRMGDSVAVSWVCLLHLSVCGVQLVFVCAWGAVSDTHQLHVPGSQSGASMSVVKRRGPCCCSVVPILAGLHLAA